MCPTHEFRFIITQDAQERPAPSKVGLSPQAVFSDPEPFKFGSTHPRDGGQSPIRVTIK